MTANFVCQFASHGTAWGLNPNTSSEVAAPSQAHGFEAVIGVFVSAVADVHQANPDFGFFIQAVHHIKRGSEVEATAQ